MNPETASAGLSLLEAGESFAWATIIDSRGSAPRHAGASMLVRTDGSIAGTIGGGALEAAAIRHALTVLATGEPFLMDYTLTSADSARLGMICGGSGLAFIDCVDPADAAAQDLFRAALDLLRNGRKGWLVTIVPETDPQAGRAGRAAGRCLVDSSGTVVGPPVCPPELVEELTGGGGVNRQVTADKTSRIYVQPLGMRGTAYVFGAGHCGVRLVSLLGLVDFFTVVVDDRADFASRGRFPSADRLVVPDSFAGAFGGLYVDEDSYIVIMTRGHLHDRTVLEQALRTRAGYVGMIGSKKKVAETFRALQEEGFSPDDLARVHAPIGLSIGSETPEEIAVSIAAQLIQARANRGR